MKWTNLAIIFSVFMIMAMVVMDVRVNSITVINNKDREYTSYLENAVDDGTLNLVELDSSRKNLVLKKEKAVDQFYLSLFSNFGVIGNASEQDLLSNYIPIILVTDVDGFYLYYTDVFQTNNGNIYKKRWSEKFPYTYKDGNLIYHFSVGDSNYIKIYDSSTGSAQEGNINDLKNSYPDSVLGNPEKYDTYRRNAIINTIQAKMNIYINQYNNIAYQKGITYHFWLPQIEKADWYRTIDDISMFVIFQGYPYQVGSQDTYNRYAFGGARIRKTKTYFITEENGMKYYHKNGCAHINGSTGETFYSKEDCAIEGAFPDPDCNP